MPLDAHPPMAVSLAKANGDAAETQEHLAQILLLNQYEERVEVFPDGLMMPAYTEAKRLSVTGNAGEISLAQFTQQSTTIVQKTRTLCRQRFGERLTMLYQRCLVESG